MKRRSFLQILGLIPVALSLPKFADTAQVNQSPVTEIRGYHCRPQKTVDDLVHEMHCWVNDIQDDHDLVVSGVRARVHVQRPNFKWAAKPNKGNITDHWIDIRQGA